MHFQNERFNKSVPENSYSFQKNSFFREFGFQGLNCIIICGEFNARSGEECDYIDGEYPVPPREVLDEQCNTFGYQLIDILVDCNLGPIPRRL